MSYKSILTYGSRIASVEQLYEAPVSVIPPNYNTPLASLYFVLAKNDPWVDDNDPPQPTQDQASLKQFLKSVFVAKYVPSNNISPVIERRDWTQNMVYDYYDDTIDMFELDDNGFLIYNFYVKNRYDQVFKCLWNNNGGPSLYEPYFEPGSYNTNNIYQNNDGYKWKYIFTVDSAAKVKFMDSLWIPVPIGLNTPNPLYNLNTGQPAAAGVGNIDVINVTNGGSGYTSNSIITVTVTGDGTGATASATLANGSISDIIVTNPGSNYTYASVTISSNFGSGATAIAPVSPIGGHGFDAASELGCSRAMVTSEFNGSENGIIPTDVTYYQAGILINPTTQGLGGLPANASIYSTTTDLIVAPGFGVFVNDEYVYQGNSLDTATFKAKVLSFDTASNTIRLINTVGSLTTNAPVFGNTSKTVRTLLNYNLPDFITLSGYIAFMENRSGIQRSSDGIEQFKFVLGY